MAVQWVPPRVRGRMEAQGFMRMALPLARASRRRFRESFSIMDADMECEVPFVIAIAWSFDVLEVVRAFCEQIRSQYSLG